MEDETGILQNDLSIDRKLRHRYFPERCRQQNLEEHGKTRGSTNKNSIGRRNQSLEEKPTTPASKLAQKLLAKAKVKLVAARKLCDADLWEDSASRSYYAMFHAARAALIQIGKSPKTHEGTVSEFGRRLVLNGTFPREMGRAFADAKSARETYEYSTIEEISSDEAENLLENGEKFVSHVEKYLGTRKKSADTRASARSKGGEKKDRNLKFKTSLPGFRFEGEAHEASRYRFPGKK